MKDDSKLLEHALEGFEEELPVAVIPVDGFAFIATGGDVVAGSRIFDPDGTSHARSLPNKIDYGKVKSVES